MMKKFFYYFLLVAVSVSFYACSNNDDPEPIVDPVETVDTNSFFILNRGSYYSGIDGTLSYYDYASEDYKIVKESINIFKDSNERSLGGSPNDMAIYRDSLYVLVYESATMEVVDTKTMKSVYTYNFQENPHSELKSQPRHIAISNGIAYITTYDGYLVSYSCDERKVTGWTSLVNEGNNPEGVAVVGNEIYVAMSGGLNSAQGLPYDNKVARINKNTMELLESIKVGINPTEIITNGVDATFVICMGDYAGTAPMIYQIMGNIATPRCPGTFMALYNRQLYVINAAWDSSDGNTVWNKSNITYKCYAIDKWNDSSVQPTDFLPEGKGVDYPSAFAIDPVTGNFVIGSSLVNGSTVSFNENGYFKMYSGTGEELLTGETGIDPYIVTFVPQVKLNNSFIQKI
ncbi:MAG: hypothetical protein K2G74_02500 [Muribaculaceae bacterium]|nr:hypothetical protein [Muribaculaceae bacterium]